MSKKSGAERKVNGSDDLSMVRAIGIEPTTPTVSRQSNGFERVSADLRCGAEYIEIPSDFRVVPAVEYHSGKFRLFRVLVKSHPERGDFAVTSRRAKKVR
jgi:hypothetical protein